MDAVEEIKSRLEVDDVLSGYIQLKPAGANFKAVCPFHHEKTASLMVSPEKGIWHCFGCGEGGDIFTFVMKMEGLDFKEALQRLAEKAGIDLPERGSPRQTQQKEALLKVMEFATKYYQALLAKDKKAQGYIRNRGVNDKIIKDFRLGYTGPATGGLSNELKKRGVAEKDIIAAGLARQRGSGLVDIFRGRLMVPLADPQGRSVGFTGRVLDDSLPKYLNTPQTLLFDKSRFLFGLHLARNSIRERDEAVVVEGNLDVVSSHQVGVTNVVASSGTALTLWQLKALSRLTKNVKLAFDQDAAGLAATERSIPIAQEAGVSLYIVKLVGAKDPDDLIQSPSADGPKLWGQAIEGAEYVMDWLLNALQGQYDLDTVPGKKRMSDHFLKILAKLPDPVEQDHYANKLAELIEVSVQSILSKLQKDLPQKAQPQQAAQMHQDVPTDENATVESALLAVTTTYPDTRVSLQDVGEDHFSSLERKTMFNYLANNRDVDLEKNIPGDLQSLENYVKILILQGEEQFRDWAPLDRRIEAFGLAGRLQTLFIKRTQKQLQNEIKASEAANDTVTTEKLLKKFRDLSRKLN